VRIHYIEQGSGDPILFLHGNPTWSYLWRNIIPIVTPHGRCLAMDLIGFGKSDKPNIDYGYADHVKYVDGFIEALGLKNLTLMVHDWGGAFGFDYALRHRNNVAGIAFMEALSFTFRWESFLEGARETFQAFRTPEIGWRMIGEENVFIEQLMPRLILRPLSQEEHDAYRMPFPTVESRKPVWRMPNLLPFGDRPDDAYHAVKRIEEGLPTLTMPTLLLWAHPGAVVDRTERVQWLRDRLRNLTVVDVGQGLHYIQEDQPDAIGHAIVRWLDQTYRTGY
jgi:haloalkane dehalogenase